MARSQQRMAMAKYPFSSDCDFPTPFFRKRLQLSYLSKILMQVGTMSRAAMRSTCSFFCMPLGMVRSLDSWSMQLRTCCFSEGRRSWRTSSMRSLKTTGSSSLESCSTPTSQLRWQSNSDCAAMSSVIPATLSGCSYLNYFPSLPTLSPQRRRLNSMALRMVWWKRRQQRDYF